jgi:DNA-binding MarR family transcriptional regulator
MLFVEYLIILNLTVLDPQNISLQHSKHLEILKQFRIIIQSAQNHSLSIKKKCGISGSQLWVLQEIALHPEIKVGELAGLMSLKSSTVSNLLENLAMNKLIIRSTDKKDKRQVRLQLSALGINLLKKAPKPSRGSLPESLSLLDKTTQKKLYEALSILLETMGKVDHEAALKPLPFTL